METDRTNVFRVWGGMGGAKTPECEAQIIYHDKAQSLKRDQLEVTRIPKQSKRRGDGLSRRQRTLVPFQPTKWLILCFRASTGIFPSSHSHPLLDWLRFWLRSNATSSKKPPRAPTPCSPKLLWEGLDTTQHFHATCGLYWPDTTLAFPLISFSQPQGGGYYYLHTIITVEPSGLDSKSSSTACGGTWGWCLLLSEPHGLHL